MSVRWMAVQYVGNTLRLPVVNDGDMNKPFGSSVLERDVKRIVVNPFSDSPQTFVPEFENAKLRELSATMLKCIEAHRQKKSVCWECPAHKQFDELRWLCCIAHEASELGVEV